jgi:hypothetical protein
MFYNTENKGLYLDLCRRPLEQDRHTAKLKIKVWENCSIQKCERQRVSNEESEEKTEN